MDAASSSIDSEDGASIKEDLRSDETDRVRTPFILSRILRSSAILT